jgi:hypothetical protein
VHKLVFMWPKRLKHVAIKHTFVYDYIQCKDISINYIYGFSAFLLVSRPSNTIELLIGTLCGQAI